MPKPAGDERKQVTGRLTSDERKQFAAYAESLGLDGGTVATLLMSRELRLRRLERLRADPRFREVVGANRTITSHRFSASDKQRFHDHIRKVDVSASKAVGILCRAELVERWLEQALSFDSDRVEN